MARIWRNPGVLMTAYLVLSAIAGTWASTRAPTGTPQAQQLPDMGSVAIAAFLAWRVTRGGAIARGLIVVFTGLLIWSLVVSADMRTGGLVSLGLMAICVVQLALVVSRPIYDRTRNEWTGQPPGTGRLWPAPPWWMAAAALAAGLLLTLLGLASMGWHRVPACPTPRSQCITLAEGYPVHFLSTVPSGSGHTVAAYPSMNWGAAVEDGAIWTALSFSACYLVWLPAHRPARAAAPRAAAPA